MRKLKTSKKGLICKSDLTGNLYRVTKWYDLGNGKIEAIHKETYLIGKKS